VTEPPHAPSTKGEIIIGYFPQSLFHGSGAVLLVSLSLSSRQLHIMQLLLRFAALRIGFSMLFGNPQLPVSNLHDLKHRTRLTFAFNLRQATSKTSVHYVS
jgi:hypothetical protein